MRADGKVLRWSARDRCSALRSTDIMIYLAGDPDAARDAG